MSRLSGAALTLIPALAACSGEPPLAGVYRVELAAASAPCGEDLPIEVPPYLRFVEGVLFGIPYHAYLLCADEDALECVPAGSPAEAFFEEREDGWYGAVASASGPDGDCALRLRDKSAVQDGDRLTVEELTYGEDHLALPLGGCTPGEAEARAGAMPCIEHLRITARRR